MSNTSTKQRQLQLVTNKGEIPPERSEHELLIMQRIKKQQQAIRQRMQERNNALISKSSSPEERAFNVLQEVNGIEQDMYKRSLSDLELVSDEKSERITELEVFQVPNYSRMQGLDLFPHLTSFFGCMQRFERMEGLNMCVGLRKQYLDDNSISTIEGLDQCTALEEQYLKNNRIRTISGLEKLRSLKILDLSENYIECIDTNKLSVCSSLQVLRIGNNLLRCTLELCATGLPLIELNLAGNQISGLIDVKRVLESFPLLERVWLQHPDNGTNPVCGLPGYHAYCLNVIYNGGYIEQPVLAVMDNTVLGSFTSNVGKTVKSAMLRRCLAVQTAGFSLRQQLHKVLGITPILLSQYNVQSSHTALSLSKPLIVIVELLLKALRESTSIDPAGGDIETELTMCMSQYAAGKSYTPKSVISVGDVVDYYQQQSSEYTLPAEYSTALQALGNLLSCTASLPDFKGEVPVKTGKEHFLAFVYSLISQQKSTVEDVLVAHQEQTQLVNAQYSALLHGQMEEQEKGLSSSHEVYKPDQGIVMVDTNAVCSTVLCSIGSANTNGTSNSTCNLTNNNNFIHISNNPIEPPGWVTGIAHWHSHDSHHQQNSSTAHVVHELVRVHDQEHVARHVAAQKQRQMERRQDDFFAKTHMFTACKMQSCVPESLALAAKTAKIYLRLATGISGAAFLSRDFTSDQRLSTTTVLNCSAHSDSLDPGIVHFFYKVTCKDVDFHCENAELMRAHSVSVDGNIIVVTDDLHTALLLSNQVGNSRYELEIVQVYTGAAVRIDKQHSKCTCTDNIVCNSLNSTPCVSEFSDPTVMDDRCFLFRYQYLHAYSAAISSQLDAIAVTDASENPTHSRLSTYRQSPLASSLLLRSQPNIQFRPLPSGTVCPQRSQSKSTLSRMPALAPETAVHQSRVNSPELEDAHLQAIRSNTTTTTTNTSTLVCPPLNNIKHPLSVVDSLVVYPYTYQCDNSSNPAILYIRDSDLVLPYCKITGSLSDLNPTSLHDCHIASNTRPIKLQHSLHSLCIPVTGFMSNMQLPILPNVQVSCSDNYITPSGHPYLALFSNVTHSSKQSTASTATTTATTDYTSLIRVNKSTPVMITQNLVIAPPSSGVTPPHLLLLFTLYSTYLRTKLLSLLPFLTPSDFQALLQTITAHCAQYHAQTTSHIATLPRLVVFSLVCSTSVVKNVLQQFLQFPPDALLSIPYPNQPDSQGALVPAVSRTICPVMQSALCSVLDSVYASYIASTFRLCHTPALGVWDALVDSAVCETINEKTAEFSLESQFCMLLKSSYQQCVPIDVAEMCRVSNNSGVCSVNATTGSVQHQLQQQVQPQNMECQFEHVLNAFIAKSASVVVAGSVQDRLAYVLEKDHGLRIDRTQLMATLCTHISIIHVDGAMLFDGVKQATVLKQHSSSGGLAVLFRQMQQLQSLTLSNCLLTNVEFLVCPNLRVLDLTLNDLTSLSSLPITVKSLDTVILHGNKFSNLSSLTIPQFRSLKNVTISGNRVCNISPQSVQPNLTFVSASDNQITNTSQIAILHACTQLYTLNLENNPICASISPSWLLHYLPSIRFYNNSVIPLPIKLRDYTGHLDEYTVLSTMLARKDPQLGTQNASRCGCLHGCDEVPVSYLATPSQNNSGGSNSKASKTCPGSVQPLLVQFLEKPLSFKNVTVLDQTSQHLKNIDYISDSVFPSLTTLILDHNDLSNLSSLKLLPKLTTLRLNHNRIVSSSLLAQTGVPAEALGLRHFVPSQAVLELAHNLISNISGLKLQGQNKLVALGLENNQLTRIDGLAELPALQHQVLNHNVLKKISYGSLSELVNLRELQIEHNHLATLVGIGALPNLIALFLRGNNLCAMSSIQSLETINGDDSARISGHPGFSEVCLQENPLTRAPNYRLAMITKFSTLRVLDGIEISQAEVFEAKQLADMEAANDYRPQLLLNSGGIVIPSTIHAHNLLFTGPPPVYTIGLKQVVQQGQTPLQIQGLARKKEEHPPPRMKPSGLQQGLVGNSFGSLNPQDLHRKNNLGKKR